MSLHAIHHAGSGPSWALRALGGRSAVCFAPEVGDGTPSPTPSAAQPEPATFSVDYVRELRAENKGYRLKASELERSAAEAKAALEKAAADKETAITAAKAEADAKIADAASRASKRLIAAELRAGAKENGLAHPDFLRLLDTGAVSVGDDGEVAVPKDFWAKAKESNPHLFASTGADKGTTSNPAAPPKPAQGGSKHLKDMTPQERAAAMRKVRATGVV